MAHGDQHRCGIGEFPRAIPGDREDSETSNALPRGGLLQQAALAIRAVMTAMEKTVEAQEVVAMMMVRDLLNRAFQSAPQGLVSRFSASAVCPRQDSGLGHHSAQI